MAKEKGISTLAGIIIIILVVIIIFGGVFAYQYFSTKTNKTQTVQPSITVISPNGGEVFKPGQHMNITWNADSNYSTVQAMVVAGKAADGQYTNNGSMASVRGYVIYTGANTGSFDWIVPTEYPDAGNYLVRIEPQTSSGQSSGQVDYSDNYFSIVAPTADSTAGWKTYTNSKYGFEIKYPNNFYISEGDATSPTSLVNGEETSIVLNVGTPNTEGYKNVQEYVDKEDKISAGYGIKIINTEKTSLSGYNAIEQIMQRNSLPGSASPTLNSITTYFIGKGNSVGYFYFSPQYNSNVGVTAQNEISLYRLILSTFKFTK